MATIDELLIEAYSNWDDAETLRRVGIEIHDRNRLGAAREVLRRAVELNPKDAKAWEWLSFAHFRDYQGEEGLNTMRDGIEATDSDVLRATLIGFSEDEEEQKALTELLEGTKDPGAKAGMVWGKLFSGEAEAALAEVRELYAAHPDDEDVRNTLVWALLTAKRQKVVEDLDLRAEALPVIEARIAAEPGRVGGHSMKLMVLDGLEDWDGLLAATGEMLAEFPDDETVMQFRGKAYREKDDLARAAQWFSRAIGAKPSFAGARVDLGRTFEKMGMLDLAEEVFSEIPAANPDYPGGPISLALFCARQGRMEEAEDLFISAWPDLPPWNRGGVTQNPEAKELLEREKVKQVMES